MAKRYLLGLPLELLAGDREEEKELNQLLGEELDGDDYVDEDVIISSLLFAARHGDKEAAKELEEFLGDVE